MSRRSLILVAVLLASTVAMLSRAAVAAESPRPKAENVDVEVMPEYDDPRVLVVLRATLSSDAALPAKVAFTIPKGEVEINMACELTDPNGMACKPTEIADKGDYQEVSFTTQSSRKVMFEYYYKPPGFPAAGAKKFTYKFIPTFSNIAQLSLGIQQPRTAREFRVSPAAATTSQDDKDKLTYHLYNFGNVTPDQPMSFSVSYKKDDPATSVAPKGSPEGETSSSSGFSLAKLLPLVAVLAIVGIIVYWMLPGSRKKLMPSVTGATNAQKSRKTTKASGKSPKKSKGAKVASFCPECGTRAERGDKFCSACGTGLRTG